MRDVLLRRFGLGRRILTFGGLESRIRGLQKNSKEWKDGLSEPDEKSGSHLLLTRPAPEDYPPKSTMRERMIADET